MSKDLVIIAGAGDVGSRLAALRIACGDDVIAIRRRDVTAGDGVRAHRADLATGEGLSTLPRQAVSIVYCAAPDQRDEAAYRALFHDGLRRLLDAVEAPRVVFVSSTAVYGQDAGEWVDEGTPALPAAFNGRVLLDAERVLAPLPGGTRAAAFRPVRAGPRAPAAQGARRRGGRAALDQPHPRAGRRRRAVAPARPAQPAAAVPGQRRPAARWRPRCWPGCATPKGCRRCAAAGGPERGRRVRNARLRASGWVPGHEDYRSGYAGLLAEPGV